MNLPGVSSGDSWLFNFLIPSADVSGVSLGDPCSFSFLIPLADASSFFIISFSNFLIPLTDASVGFSILNPDSASFLDTPAATESFKVIKEQKLV